MSNRLLQYEHCKPTAASESAPVTETLTQPMSATAAAAAPLVDSCARLHGSDTERLTPVSSNYSENTIPILQGVCPPFSLSDTLRHRKTPQVLMLDGSWLTTTSQESRQCSWSVVGCYLCH